MHRSGLWLAVALCVACNTQGDVREWTAADHSGEQKQGGQVDGIVAPGEEDMVLVRAAWKDNCLRCHGADGTGNTPEGRQNRSPDLTQTKSSNEELKNTIVKGRNKMPAFGTQLPPKVLDGIIVLIRGFNAQGTRKK